MQINFRFFIRLVLSAVLIVTQISKVKCNFSSNNLIRNLYGYQSSSRCPCSCGLTNRKKGRVYGGKITQFNEYPWVVALLYQGHYFCAGTLINERYVLTAAHCIRGIRVNKLMVLVGEHVRSFPVETHSEYFPVVHSVFHHLFNKSTYDNDIGILKLGRRVPYKWYSRPACLPSPEKSYTGEMGTVTGWGKMGEHGEASDSLRHITIPIVSNSLCQTEFKYKGKDITDNMICAGYKDGHKDSCHGDSGGGLLWEGADRKIDVIGVVSWGEGCGRPGYPGIYTKVSKYLSWIAYHTRDSCFCGRRQPRV